MVNRVSSHWISDGTRVGGPSLIAERQPLRYQEIERCEPAGTPDAPTTRGRSQQRGPSGRAIRTRLEGVIAELETVKAIMSAESLRPEADSLATVIADLQWQCEELGEAN